MGHCRKQCISFFVSSNCNLNCVYCYIPHFGSRIDPADKVIDLDFAIAGMKDYFDWAEPSIRFFAAGEATVEFRRMVEITEAANKLAGRKVKVELQTNGYFGEEVAGWIDENVDILWISCDGPPELHDPQRPNLGGRPTSDVVVENIRRFAKNPRIQAGARATFFQQNFGRQIEVLEYFRSLGLTYVCGAPAYSSTVNANIAVPMLVDFAQHFVPAFEHARKIGMFYQTHLIVNFDEEVTCYCRAAARPTHPQLTSDGYVSCCDWACFGPKYLPGVLQQCIFGKWDKENKQIVYFAEEKERIETRDIAHLGEGDCKGCSVLKHCAGGCIGKVMVRSNDLHRMDPNWCAAVQYLARHIPQNEGLYPVRHS